MIYTTSISVTIAGKPLLVSIVLSPVSRASLVLDALKLEPITKKQARLLIVELFRSEQVERPDDLGGMVLEVYRALADVL